MTTGRINQVRTVSGASAPAVPRLPACGSAGGPDGRARTPRPGLAPGPLALRRRARGLCPVRAASDARARLPAPRAGAERARRGGHPSRARSPTPGLRRPRLAGPRSRFLLSFSRSPSERRHRHVSSRGAPLGTVRPCTVTRTKACDPSATASALPLGRPPPAETPPGYAAATARLTPRACLDATAHQGLPSGLRRAVGRHGAGGIFLASRNAAVSPFPPFSAGRRGASHSPPHEPPAAGSRSGAGQMPESGDESQGIAVKGLLCPLRYPGSDLGHLRMIWRPHAKLERCRVGPNWAQSARARGPCPVAR